MDPKTTYCPYVYAPYLVLIIMILVINASVYEFYYYGGAYVISN